MRRLLAALFTGALVLGLFAAPASASTPGTIADVAVANGNFTTLVSALSCTGLVPAVADPSAKLTVFAPTDAAFGRFGLNAGNVCRLPHGLLTKVLLYHVAAGELYAKDVLSTPRIKMLNGLYTFPSVRNGNAYVNRYAKIVAADVQASNGVIHVINNVLIPYWLF